MGVRNVRFSENLACFVFLEHPFWDSSFCLITDETLPSSVLIVTKIIISLVSLQVYECSKSSIKTIKIYWICSKLLITSFWLSLLLTLNKLTYQFQANVQFLRPLTPENLWYSDVFRRYRNETLGLKWVKLINLVFLLLTLNVKLLADVVRDSATFANITKLTEVNISCF